MGLQSERRGNTDANKESPAGWDDGEFSAGNSGSESLCGGSGLSGVFLGLFVVA